MLRMLALLAAILFASACGSSSLVAQVDTTRTDSSAQKTQTGPPSEDTVADVDEYPTPIKRVAPVYPMEAQVRRITGKVLVKVLVGRDGDPMTAKIYKSDAKELEKASIESVMKWKFKPAMMKGTPVEFWIVIPFQYNLGK